MRILVIDDDQAVCEVFGEFLHEIGHEPVITHTAETALDSLREERPDAVLLDVCLPGMSGLDFMKLPAVRDLSVPILVISGRATESQAQEAMRAGAFDFIGKPVALRRLQEALACFESPAENKAKVKEDEVPPERRRAPRALISLPVRIREQSGAEWESTSVNLSASGIKVRANGSRRTAGVATLSITLPESDTQLEVPSILVRADDEGFAFAFKDRGDERLQELNELVRRSAGAPTVDVESHVRILHRIGEAISATLDVDEVLRIALDALTHVTGHEISSLHLISPDGATLELRGDRGLRPRLREINSVLQIGQGLIGGVAATGKTLHWAHVSESADLLPAARAAVTQEGIHAFVCVPIQSRGRILGALSLGRRTREAFSESEIALVEACANQIGLALQNAQLYSATRSQLEDLKSAEAQLIEGEKLSTVGKLAAGLAHETRNRLTAILGQAELLLMGSDDPAKSRERLHTIVQETSRAAQMLQNLLRFTSRHSAERHPCRLEDQIQWVVELKSHQLRRDSVKVVTDFGNVRPVLADEGQIQQVLLNLVQNAHQAMANHQGEREITLRLSESGGPNVRLEVLDSGPGIHPNVLPRIFDAFTTTKAPGEGTGLGLWVSYSIVEQHQGSLRAVNRPEGGAAFIVELPAATG
ncbi:MAG TPA: ATP-binding protein [Methylomirabilota bacterium]|nr:ATP-binding protein [Methylomirabilota bacterium]